MAGSQASSVMKVFDNPTTPFNERLDEIVAMARDWKPIDRAWPSPDGIAWLRDAFAGHWHEEYPQPYVGAGPDDAMLSLCWMSDDENVTLEVDTVNRTGDLYVASSHGNIDVECAFDLDLDNADAWQQIASALGVELGRNGNILAIGLAGPVPERQNTEPRIPA